VSHRVWHIDGALNMVVRSSELTANSVQRISLDVLKSGMVNFLKEKKADILEKMH